MVPSTAVYAHSGPLTPHPHILPIPTPPPNTHLPRILPNSCSRMGFFSLVSASSMCFSSHSRWKVALWLQAAAAPTGPAGSTASYVTGPCAELAQLGTGCAVFPFIWKMLPSPCQTMNILLAGRLMKPGEELPQSMPASPSLLPAAPLPIHGHNKHAVPMVPLTFASCRATWRTSRQPRRGAGSMAGQQGGPVEAA